MVQSAEYTKSYNSLELRIDHRTINGLNLTHPSINQSLSIDRLVFTSGGIFVIQYNGAKGMIDGSLERPIWLSDGDIRIKNPLYENEKTIQALKEIIPPYFHDYIYSVIGFKKRVKLNVQGNHRNIEGNQWMLGENEIPEYIERVILKKNALNHQPIKPHHLNILERGFVWMCQA